MNISKYNQKLLAVLGTTALIALFIAITLMIGASFSSFFRGSSSQNQGVQIKPIVESKDSVIVRTQHITFQTPIQLDTALGNYLIPVGQVNLENEESIKFESGSGFKFSGGSYKSYRGLSNNFILFENAEDRKTQIFKDKMAITTWARIKTSNNYTLIFKGTNLDSNDDQIINGSDFQSLYVYPLNNRNLIELSFENKTVLEFEYLNKTDLVSILVGVDINGDKEYDYRTEPKELIAFDLKERKQVQFVPDSIKNNLQNLLDK